MITNASTPKDTLVAGSNILNGVLLPQGFVFEFRGDGRGSGGNFAWGEFVRGDRRLELHYRESLGLVSYHVGDRRATHESYMRELGVLKAIRYPGFSTAPSQAFHDLAHDLGFAADFLSGNASVLRAAAAIEAAAHTQLSTDLMARAVGDTRNLENMHNLFRQKRYADVLALFAEIKYPDRLTKLQQQMIKVARERASR